jgi:protein gp37
MSDQSQIEWTDSTWNPATGCSKISQGCKNCYAESYWERLPMNPKTAYFGRAFTDVMTHPDRLDQPLRWKRPRKIFVNSMSDLFHESIPDQFIDQVWRVMAGAMHHKFQVLTKRPERMRAYLRGNHARGIKMDWGNIWIGVSAEDQETANERIPILLDTPAAVRWVSAEPLLGPINFRRWFFFQVAARPADCPAAPGIDWVVVGGESGPKARPMDPAWVRVLRDQCVHYRIPFLFKQWGEYGPNWYNDDAGVMIPGSEWVDRMGKKKAGRVLDGRTWDQYPKTGGEL